MADVNDKMPFMEHLGELRTRIVRGLLGLLVGLGIALPFSQKIVDYLARPVRATGNNLVFLSLTEAFWVQMKVAVIVGLFIAAPAILWQIWAFIAPGLHEHERKYAAPFVLIGSVLFIGGGAFSLKVVTPYAISFLLSYSRPGLQPMISIGSYVDFLLKFTLAFGLVFELPLIINPRRLHRGGHPDADARCVQPDLDGGAADHPLRGRHHLRPHLRPPPQAGPGGHRDSRVTDAV